jgi:hypothetical protein
MDRNWTPESRVSVTDAGMVIKIKLSVVLVAEVNF